MGSEMCIRDRFLDIVDKLLFTYSLIFFFRGNIELGDITQHNIKQLKHQDQVVLPVTYNDKFYKDVLEVGELAKLGKNSPIQR